MNILGKERYRMEQNILTETRNQFMNSISMNGKSFYYAVSDSYYGALELLLYWKMCQSLSYGYSRS
jgi:hypothetical protein